MLRTLSLIMLLGIGLSAHAAPLQCAQPLLGLDAKGTVTQGARHAVVEAASAGRRLRVGWRLVWGEEPNENILHWVDAGFVTVFENQVFTQLPRIHVQHPLPGKAGISLSEKVRYWHASLGTDGKLVHRMGEAELSTDQVEQLWCVLD